MHPGGGGSRRRAGGGSSRDHDQMVSNPYSDAFSGRAQRRRRDNDDWIIGDENRKKHEYKSKRTLNEKNTAEQLNVANLVRAR